MHRVLIIEDETVLRSSVARGIAKLGTEVYEAGTLNDALTIVDRAPPDLVISDIDLPERSGLELLGELGRRDLKVPVVFVSGYLNAYRSQIPHHAAVEVLEKPVPIEELRQVVRRRLGDDSAAEASPFGVPDYLQLACMGRHSVMIEVEKDGNIVGEVVISSGEILSAKDDHGRGLAALGRLTFEDGALVRCRRLLGDPPQRELDGGWEYLLMEAARVVDETRRSQEMSAVEANDDARFESAFDDGDGAGEGRPEPRIGEADDEREEPLSEQQHAFNALWDEGLDAMFAKNYQAALEVFERAGAIFPDDPRLKANIKRLHELGYGTDANEVTEEGVG